MNDLPQVMNKKNEWSSPSNEQMNEWFTPMVNLHWLGLEWAEGGLGDLSPGPERLLQLRWEQLWLYGQEEQGCQGTGLAPVRHVPQTLKSCRNIHTVYSSVMLGFHVPFLMINIIFL